LNGPSGPGRVTRRSLIKGAGGLAIGASAAGALAGCENTTEAVAVSSGTPAGGGGLLGDPTAGGPVDSFGIPLARRDYPVTLPRLHDPVATGTKPERGGQLKIFNYADYLNPAVLKKFGKQEGVSVRVTTFDSLDEAFAKLNAGLQFDVIFLSPDILSKWVGAKHIAPMNRDLVPNLDKTVWPELHSPPYDVEARYSVPYTTYTTGIGWRNDKITEDVAKLGWDALWQAEKYKGKVGILDDGREALGMALMRNGVANLNTEDPALIEQAKKDLQDLTSKTHAKIDINEYESLPAGRSWIHQSWSGDLLAAVVGGYLPKNTPPTVLSYWYQVQGGPVYNDIITVAEKATKPVMAHRFLNYMLDPKVAYQNFVGYVGYQPPITSIDPNALFTKGIIPKQLSNAVITRDAYANGNAYMGLTAKGDQLWTSSWASVRNG